MAEIVTHGKYLGNNRQVDLSVVPPYSENNLGLSISGMNEILTKDLKYILSNTQDVFKLDVDGLYKNIGTMQSLIPGFPSGYTTVGDGPAQNEDGSVICFPIDTPHNVYPVKRRLALIGYNSSTEEFSLLDITDEEENDVRPGSSNTMALSPDATLAVIQYHRTSLFPAAGLVKIYWISGGNFTGDSAEIPISYASLIEGVHCYFPNSSVSGDPNERTLYITAESGPNSYLSVLTVGATSSSTHNLSSPMNARFDVGSVRYGLNDNDYCCPKVINYGGRLMLVGNGGSWDPSSQYSPTNTALLGWEILPGPTVGNENKFSQGEILIDVFSGSNLSSPSGNGSGDDREFFCGDNDELYLLNLDLDGVWSVHKTYLSEPWLGYGGFLITSSTRTPDTDPPTSIRRRAWIRLLRPRLT